MPIAALLQSSFNKGEISPLMHGRVDIAAYKNALATCLNWIPLIQGGLTRRPGSRFVAEVKDSTKPVRLVRFEFSTTQAYVLEFGDKYIRFYANDGQVVTAPNTPYEIATPYAAADLFQLKFTQSADVLYIAHKNYPPAKLMRYGATNWQLQTISFQDGPYIQSNSTTTTLTPSAATGSITITASSTTGINGGSGFQASDVGRCIRIRQGSAPVQWGWATITAVNSTTSVTATVEGNGFLNTTASAIWRLGLWGTANGYPACVTFYEDRLVWGGCAQYPQRIDASNSGDYENMAPSEADDTVTDSNALSFSLNANTVNNIRWLQNDERGLLAGTAGGEWVVRASTTQVALTPTNVSAKQSTAYGSADVEAIRVGKATLFVQNAARKVREMAYVFTIDGFLASDVTLLSEHITASGIKQVGLQKTPLTQMWAVRNDGVLLGFTYEKEQEVAGWHRHVIGGWYDAAKTQPAQVESVVCIPAPDSSRDEVWILVNRYINGANHRYVEVLNKMWDHGDTLANAFYVDAGLTYNGAPATQISGLNHLEGQTVQVLADGATHPDVTVTNGAVTLVRAASTVNIGFGYNSDGQTLRIEGGAANGTAQGKLKRIHRVTFRFMDTVGFLVGKDFSSLDDIPFRTSADPMNQPPALFSGDKRVDWEGDYDMDGQICFRQGQPLPATLLAVMPQFDTQDAA